MKKRVRAIIIDHDEILTIKRIKPNDIYWVFPGGGVEKGETEKQALIRECEEELGVEVEVGKFVEKDYSEWKGKKEEIKFYECKIISGNVGSGTGPEFDENSIYEGLFEVQWLKIEELHEIDLRPGKIKEILT